MEEGDEKEHQEDTYEPTKDVSSMVDHLIHDESWGGALYVKLLTIMHLLLGQLNMKKRWIV